MIRGIIKTIFHLSRSGVLENLTYKILKAAVSAAKLYYINNVLKDVWCIFKTFQDLQLVSVVNSRNRSSKWQQH